MIIYNNIIPVKGFAALAAWPVIFARKKFKSGSKAFETILNHEKIHHAQQLEVTVLAIILLCFLTIFGSSIHNILFAPVSFYILYLINWIALLGLGYKGKKAYENIVFEKEAKHFERNKDYLKTRKFFNFLKLKYVN